MVILLRHTPCFLTEVSETAWTIGTRTFGSAGSRGRGFGIINWSVNLDTKNDGKPPQRHLSFAPEGQDFFTADLDFHAQRRANVAALHDAATNPHVSGEIRGF